MNRPWLSLLIVGLGLLPGCHRTTATPRPTDRELQRTAQDAAQAFAEGDVREAQAKYRQSLYRAWAIDDAAEAGTHAYNLAAIYLTLEQDDVATRWLVDARIELRRGGRSLGNTYLLQAKIAQRASRYQEAASWIDAAQCAPPPCNESDSDCGCDGDNACCDSCFTKLPCVGDQLKSKQAIRDCQDQYQAQVLLARARVAAEQYDIDAACRCFEQAEVIAQSICDHGLRAETHNVAALIHLAKGEMRQAACHFDREARYLQLAGNFREIPGALELAAAAHQSAGNVATAAARTLRIAKIHFGRGELRQSWDFVKSAAAMAQLADGQATLTQCSLLIGELEASLTKDELAELESLSEHLTLTLEST